MNLEQEEEHLYELRKEFTHSLYKTAKYLCGFKDINLKTHGPIIEALENPTKRKLIVTPRGGLKTSIGAVAFPIWKIIRNPQIRILIDSELYTNSKSHVGSIKGHLDAKGFKFLWGRFSNSEHWAASSFTISQRTKILKDPTIQAGGLGTRKIGAHVDLWILDDMNSPQNTKDRDSAKKVIDHYRAGLSILDPDGEIVILGTRYAELDLIQHVLDTEINFKGETDV